MTARATLNEWLAVLEASFIVFRLPAWFNNATKRAIKTPKIYFTEPGLAKRICLAGMCKQGMKGIEGEYKDAPKWPEEVFAVEVFDQRSRDAALAKASKNKGGTVYFLTGIYQAKKLIEVPAFTRLKGAGQARSIRVR